ncbi:MAG: WS/DGAT domain-containing protein [Ornithinibacter sp.]
MRPVTARRLDRARPEDLLQLAVDRGGRVPMAIGALLVLDAASRVPADTLQALLLARSASLPRLHQRLQSTPPLGGRAVWLDAGSAAVAQCVDAMTVAGPGTSAVLSDAVPSPGAPGVDRALLDATADLVLARLPADRPLWRARTLVRPDGTVTALALVAHHVVADGMGGLAVLGALADGPSGDPVADAGGPGGNPCGGRADGLGGTPASGPLHERAPEPVPPWGQLARDAWSERVAAVRAAPAGARHLAGGLDELGLRRPRLAERCSLLGATGDRRRLELATADLEVVRARAHACGATVNDVVVTAVTGALVELLARRGERVAELVVSVPVSLRHQGQADTLGNATGVVPVRVPAVPDPAVRLAALLGQRGRIGSPGRGGSAAVLTPGFRLLAAVGAFQGFVDHQRLVHTFVTNVRGPVQRLQVAGAEVTAVVPVAVNPGNVAVSFDVLSYAGALGVTLVCDPLLVPESAELARSVTAGLTASG